MNQVAGFLFSFGWQENDHKDKDSNLCQFVCGLLAYLGDSFLIAIFKMMKKEQVSSLCAIPSMLLIAFFQ